MPANANNFVGTKPALIRRSNVNKCQGMESGIPIWGPVYECIHMAYGMQQPAKGGIGGAREGRCRGKVFLRILWFVEVNFATTIPEPLVHQQN